MEQESAIVENAAHCNAWAQAQCEQIFVWIPNSGITLFNFCIHTTCFDGSWPRSTDSFNNLGFHGSYEHRIVSRLHPPPSRLGSISSGDMRTRAAMIRCLILDYLKTLSS